MNVVSMVALFGAGVASFFAPCVLPLVPAYVGMLGGARVDDAEPGWSLAAATAQFVVGFAAVFVGLGTVAGALGGQLTVVVDRIEVLGGVLVIAFGLALLTKRLRRTVRPFDRIARRGGPVAVGVAFGASWTPCVGPLLGAALVVAGESGGAGTGALLLGFYALGVGLPFVVIALVLGGRPSVFRRLSHAAPVVEPVAGGLLVGLGLLLVSGRYDRLVSGLARFPGLT